MMHETYNIAGLYRAIDERNLTDLTRILDEGASADAPSFAGKETPLIEAISRSFTAGALLLLRRGASPTRKGLEGQAPLHVAAGGGEFAVCSALLSAGAPIDERDDEGRTALYNGANAGNAAVCRILIDSGADVNSHTDFGSTPMSVLATRAGDDALAIMRMLVNAGASTSFEPSAGFPRLGEAPFYLAVLSGVARNVQFMLDECGENPLQTTQNGNPILKVAGTAEVERILRAAITERAVRDVLPDHDDEPQSAIGRARMGGPL